MQRKSSGSRGIRGAAVVEFVLVASMLIFLLFGIMEMGFMFSNSLTVSAAAQQGARAAALGGNTVAVEAAVSNAASTLRAPREFSVGAGTIVEYAAEGTGDWHSWTPGTPPPDTTKDQIRVTVTYPYRYITGSLLGSIGRMLGGSSNQPSDQRNLVGVSVMRYGG